MALQIRPVDPRAFMEKCVAEASRRPIIRTGSSGEQVRAWQTLMQKVMSRPSAPMIRLDGIFGPQTQAVTMAFQRKSGLQPDGVVGPKTWSAAAVAPCYAAAIQQRRLAAHGVGALDLSFSVVDPKSMILGVVLGVAAGAVLFRKK